MRCGRLLVIVVLAAAAGPAMGQAQRAGAQAGPRDIREVFLAVPFPETDFIDDAVPLENVLREPGRRRAVLEAALARGAPNVLDLPNGYLRLRLPSDGPYGDSLDLVMTYFNQDGGRRLVVMQAGHVDPRSGESAGGIDHFWSLAGSTFTPVHWTEVMPEVTYQDFWGDHPLPEGHGDGFFLDWEALHVQWPRQGTTARLHLSTPGFLRDEESEAFAEDLAELFESRRFGEMELLWDRRRGVFTKGRKTPYARDGGEHDHH